MTVLLIGGRCDGQTYAVPHGIDLNGGESFSVPVMPRITSADLLASSLVPVESNYAVYRVCTLHMADTRGSESKRTTLKFAYHVDITPSEALVMLMQHYENHGEDR